MPSKKFDFFISYTNSDLAWAEWVDFRLKQAGYSTIVQFADFSAGGNIINEMHTALKSAKQVLGILSQRYLESRFAAVEWMAALHDDPLGEKRRLIFVRVEKCTLSGLLPNIIYIDLVGLTEEHAEAKFLQGVRGGVPARKYPPRFPATGNPPIYPPSFPRFWHLPIRRKPLFTGRDKLMAEIAVGFSSDTTQVIQALTGMGGAGKTRAAIEYCYRGIGNYDAIWWIDGSEERLLHQGLLRLAKELSTVKEGEDLNREELLERVENGLRDLNWLLVFDNIADPESVSGRLPRWPCGHVIVTSRNPSWSEMGRVVEVRRLEREYSIEFLVSRSGDNDLKAADALCEQLGDLPIALEQAAAYVERTRCGLESYATRFANRRREGARFDDDSERVIAGVWRISIQRLLYDDPLATVMVRVLSFLGPHRIPLQFFQTEPVSLPLKISLVLKAIFGPVRLLSRIFNGASDVRYRPLGGAYSFEMGLESLRRYALVEVNQRDVSLHPLVRSVIQSGMRPRHRKAAIKICAEMLSTALTGSNRVDEVSKLWCLHVLDLGRAAEETSVASGALIKALIDASELSRVADEEKIIEAPKTINRALNLARLLPAKERQTWEIPCLMSLVHTCKDADRFPDAADYLRQAIQLILDMKAPETWLIITALSQYGGLLLLDYQTTYAGKFYEAAVSLARSQGIKNVLLAGLLCEYAEMLRNAGEYEEAESVAVEALSMATELLGPNHMMVVGYRFNLSVIQSTKGDLTSARRNLELAYSVAREVMGDESPYLDRVGSELKALEHPEIRQMAAKIFQTPRGELNSDGIWQNNASYPVGEGLQLLFKEARDIALDNLRKVAVPAILRSGLAFNAVSDQTAALHLLIGDLSAEPEDVGRVLQPLVIPIYQAIANDPRWLESEESFPIFRDEVLTQYSVAFRSRMVFELGVVGSKKLGRVLKRSPSFEDWIRFLKRNVPNYYRLVPECLVKFERGLLEGNMQGTRRGIHGLALQLDAHFYLDRLLEKVPNK